MVGESDLKEEVERLHVVGSGESRESRVDRAGVGGDGDDLEEGGLLLVGESAERQGRMEVRRPSTEKRGKDRKTD